MKRENKMKEEIHTIQKSKVQEGDSSASTGFTTNSRTGFAECDLEADECYAKRVTFIGEDQVFTNKDKKSVITKNKNVTKTHFYIKTNGYGDAFDPNGVFSEYTQSSLDAVEDKKMWRFEKVSEMCFDLYYRFLQTGNKANLIKSERVLRNG